MKLTTKKVAIWAVMGAVVAVSASGFVRNSRRMSAEDHNVEAAYREIESLGIPLGMDAFVASYTPKPEDNNAPGLVNALGELKKFRSSLSQEERDAYNQFSWEPLGQIGSNEKLIKVFEKCQPAMKNVSDNMTKPSFVPSNDGSAPLSSPLYWGPSLKSAALLFLTQARLEFSRGNRELAIQRIREVCKISNFCSDTPDHIGRLTQNAIFENAAAATREFIIADPKNAIFYRNALLVTKFKPIGYVLRASAPATAEMCRMYTAQEVSEMLSEEIGDNESLPEPEVVKDGLPKEPKMRAILGYSLDEWLPVLRQLNPDGSVKDIEAFQKAVDKFNENLVNATEPEAKLHKFGNLDLSRILISQNRGAATMAVADAFARVVEYHKLKGTYPANLADVGVTGVDPFSKAKKPLGYSVKNGEMRVWSVGYNRVDDGGLTPEEAFDLKPNSGNRRSPDQGDMTWVMPAERIAGKS